MNSIELMEEVVTCYNYRAGCSENRIKELKIGFGMERMLRGQLEANGMSFRIGTFTYRLFLIFALKVLPPHRMGARSRPCGGNCTRSPARPAFMRASCS